jgi:HSP20 family molecular chaperone IbpA
VTEITALLTETCDGVAGASVIQVTATPVSSEDNFKCGSTNSRIRLFNHGSLQPECRFCDMSPSEPLSSAPAKEGTMKSSKTLRATTEPPARLLQPSDPDTIRWEMQQIQLAVARRAFELFEARNREHGHDWEDWFQAESELLRPVSIAISETPQCLSIRANVLGFSDNELKVSIEPRCISILGRKEMGTENAQEGTLSPDYYPDQVLRLLKLSSEIDPEGAVVELQSGVLKFELSKVAESQVKATGVGKL